MGSLFVCVKLACGKRSTFNVLLLEARNLFSIKLIN